MCPEDASGLDVRPNFSSMKTLEGKLMLVGCSADERQTQLENWF